MFDSVVVFCAFGKMNMFHSSSTFCYFQYVFYAKEFKDGLILFLYMDQDYYFNFHRFSEQLCVE